MYSLEFFALLVYYDDFKSISVIIIEINKKKQKVKQKKNIIKKLNEVILKLFFTILE